jgi:hypothetical protein
VNEVRSRIPDCPPTGLDTALHGHDGPDGRRDLRVQIAALEAELGSLAAHDPPDARGTAGTGRTQSRVLSVDELERVRDRLVARLIGARSSAEHRAEAEEGSWAALERMIANPSSSRFITISNREMGRPGCNQWQSRPRWGLLGMLMGWWRVKISSGCPLAERQPD